MQHDDLPIWLALKIKFERLTASNTPCRSFVIRLRDQDDPQDDAHPERENSAKRQKTFEHQTYVIGESSYGQANESESSLSKSGNQEQLDDFDLWTNKYATDDDELSTENVSQELAEEMSETVNEAKLRKVVYEMLRQRCTSGDEHQKEILSLPFPQKPIPVVQSCQRDLKAPALSLVNQDLLYLKKRNSGSKKFLLSLHKFPTVIFPDDDIEERTSRWIFNIKRQKEPGKPKEEVYLNSKIVQVIKIYGELGHEHKFVTKIIARRVNGSIVSITNPDYKNLNKNDIEDMYMSCINDKVLKAINRRSTLLHQQLLSLALRSIRCSPSSLNQVLERLKSYNNDVKHGYVTPSLSKEDVEYLQLFEEEIEERLRRYEIYVNRRPLGSRREHPEKSTLRERFCGMAGIKMMQHFGDKSINQMLKWNGYRKMGCYSSSLRTLYDSPIDALSQRFLPFARRGFDTTEAQVVNNRWPLIAGRILRRKDNISEAGHGNEGATSYKDKNVPINLSLEKLNYNSRSSFFTIHLGSLGLKKHIEAASTSTETVDPEWSRLDDLDLFHDNEDARAITLDNQLRSIKIGNLSINDYFSKIQNMADRLKNLGNTVKDKNLVIYALNGLDSRYKPIAKIIRHTDPLPTFSETKNKLLLEESELNEENQTDKSHVDNTSSSPTILVTSNTSTRSNNNNNQPKSVLQLCNHYAKGSCKFGDSCKFIHDSRVRGSNSNTATVGTWGRALHNSKHNTPFVNPHITRNKNNARPGWLANVAQVTNSGPPSITFHQQTPTHNTTPPHAYWTQPAQSHIQPSFATQQPASTAQTTAQPGILGPAPTFIPTQETLLPNAFSTMTLQDPSWNMDTVPKPHGANIVRSLWLFWHKYNADGSLSRYKARLVANGSSQQLGIDCNETFSPVVKPVTIRTVLGLALTRHWPVHQLDVKNAFLNGDLSESGTAYLLIYVDDIVLTASSTTLLQQIISSLHRMFLSQKKYAIELLKQAHMLNCNPTRTHVDTESKLGPEGTPVSDPTLYRSLAGGLQYLTFTRPNLSYVVQQICLYMHDPREPHLIAFKRILRYIQGTLDFGLQLYASSGPSFITYSDADWAGYLATRRSTSGYCVFLGNNLLSWSSKRQHTLSRSSAEAEYRGVANAIAETTWLRNLLWELHTPLVIATLVYCDNVSVVYLSANPVQHQRTKHIEIDIHFVRDMVTACLVRVLHVPSRYQYVNIFTKGLPSALFEEFHTSLSVWSPPAQTAG
ncbi:ribonuclease H-like domain-containing protein [Tanacetum coccineum]